MGETRPTIDSIEVGEFATHEERREWLNKNAPEFESQPGTRKPYFSSTSRLITQENRGPLGRPGTGDGTDFVRLGVYGVSSATNRTFEPYMPIVVFGAIFGGIALAVVSGVNSVSGQLAILGAGCYAGVIAITLPTNLRLNNLIASWSIQSPPDDWKSVRTGWIRFHILRTLVSVPGLICYSLSGLLGAR